MEEKLFLLSKIKPSEDNPKKISKKNLEALKASITGFKKMMSLRPIIYDKKNKIIGGSQRYTALLALGYKEVPESWVKSAANLTAKERKEFIIRDNVQSGAWDESKLANWSTDLLKEWGLNIDKAAKEYTEEKPEWHLLIKCTNEQHSQELYEQLIAQGLEVKIVS